MKKQLGFTLLELCIALSITSILVLLSAASFYYYIKLQETLYISHALTQSISYARLQAVFLKKDIIISPYKNNFQNGWIIKTEDKYLKHYPAMPAKIKKSARNYLVIHSDGTADGYESSFIYNKTKLKLNRGGRTEIEPDK